MTIDPESAYDFRKPRRLADDVEHLLSIWQRQLGVALQDRWSRLTRIPLEAGPTSLATLRAEDMRTNVSESSFVYQVMLGKSDEPTLWILPRTFALAAVAGMLGEVVDKLPEERELTDVESSLLDLVVQEIERGMAESQPGTEELPCRLQGTQRVRELGRLHEDDDRLVVTRLPLQAPYGTSELTWVLTQKSVLEFVTHISETRMAQQSHASEMKQLVDQVRIDVIVRLGEAELDVAQLANLRAGDVIMLDQRVCDPLTARVSGTPMFRVWPGRVGSRQACKIDSFAIE